ncbi:tyrosine protein phosphatase [Lactiplantibacillus plantarum EGD-AQ4]|nr:tyrosine protein phosphatase [Lactiplantibacillus plantarum EGD-AQ4]
MATTRTDYVDLHCHLLPGLDDGPQTLAQSVIMARQAVADGIRYALATPHHLDRHYQNPEPVVTAAVAVLQAELDRQQVPLTVFASQEVHLCEDLVTSSQQLLGIDAAQHYLLLELPHEHVPSYVAQVVFELLQQGTVPVIAHPERNTEMIAHPERLYELVQQGCLAQVTAGSLVGNFGRQVKCTALELVKCGLVQVIATDAHLMPQRRFMLRAGYQALAHLDESCVEQFEANARRLLNGETVAATAISRPSQRRKFWLF